jgi:hypothetical protein
VVAADHLGRIEEPPEEPDVAEHAGREALPDRGLGAGQRLVLRVDVDAGVLVAQSLCGPAR